MSSEMPNLGADIVLEFDQSVRNIQMFGQAMEGLDGKFGAIDRRVDSLRSSLSSLSTQVSRGAGKNLRAEMQRELDNLITSNGIVLSKIGTVPLKVSQETVRGVFKKAEALINTKLAESFKDLSIQIDPSMNNGKVILKDDEFKEVNRAIARLVRTQLDNMVAAIRKQGANLITAEDLSSLKMHIGKGTAQQIIGKIKQELTKVLLNPQVASEGLKLTFSEKDLNRLTSRINTKIKEAMDRSVAEVNGAKDVANLAPKLKQVYSQIDQSVAKYMQNLNTGLGAMDAGTIRTPFEQLSRQLRRFIAKELGEDVNKVSAALKGMHLSAGEVSMTEMRRQFAQLEQALNKKLQGGVQTQIKELIAEVQTVQLKTDTKLKYHVTNQINKINNAIVKKIREQVDLQFNSLLAEINSASTNPKNLNRNGRIVNSSNALKNNAAQNPANPMGSRQSSMVNDPYARRDSHYNGFGLEGAITNTLRHLMAGSMVGVPMMLLYNSMEQYKTSQLEQMKMFSNLFAQNMSNSEERAAAGDTTDAGDAARATIQDLVPFIKEASQFYAIDYGKTSEITSIGSRLLETPGEIKQFTNTVGQIYNIDREGDPVSVIAPGLEAFMGQFDVAVGEMQDRVVKPLAVATNVTNATTESILQALMRSGSTFNEAGVSPENAIALVATSIKSTGLSGENIGNFYKTILPRLQSPDTLKALDSIGISVYKDKEGINAKSADEVLDEVAKKYPTLTDAKSREVIQKSFGTLQNSKGASTLGEFDEYIKIKDAMGKFSDDQFNQLMANNTTAPILEIQRAGVASQLAITSIMEEMTPSIVAVSQAITGLSTGIREHKEALANMIHFMGMALLGFAAKFGMTKLWNGAGGAQAVARMETRDKLLGNTSKVAAWQRTGMLSNLQGVNGVNPAVAANTKDSRAFMNQALKNPALETHLTSLTNMTDAQMKNMKSYITDNGLLVKNMKDLLHVAEESKSYTPPKTLTDSERQHQSAFTAQNLYSKNLKGIDQGFASNLSNELRDPMQYATRLASPGGEKTLNFLSQMDGDETKRFQQHMDDLHKSSGKVIGDFGGLSNAVDSYNSTQQTARETMRTTNPEMVRMSGAIDEVNNQLSRSQNGMRNFNSFLGGLSSRARGGASAISGLAKSVGGLAGQMIIMAAAGELMSDIGYAANTGTVEKNLNKSTKNLSDQGRVKDSFATATDGGWFEKRWSSLWGGIARDLTGAWDGVTSPFTDKYFDSVDMSSIMAEMFKYTKDKYDINFNEADASGVGFTTGQTQRDYAKALEGKGLTLDQVLAEMNEANGDSSVNTLYKEAQVAAYKKRQEQMTQNDRDLAQVKESMDRASKERTRDDLLNGRYQTYDLETVRQTQDETVKTINTETSLKTLQATMQGFATDSDEYIKLRSEQSAKIVKVYQDELDRMNKFITDSQAELKDAEMTHEDPAAIQAIKDRIAQWQANLAEAGPEFKQKRDEQEQANKEETANSLVSRANWIAGMMTMSASNQDTLNAVSMDRNSPEYINAAWDNSQDRINAYSKQMDDLENIEPASADQENDINQQLEQLRGQIAQEQLNIKELRLQGIGLYRQDLQDNLTQMGNDFMKAQVSAGTSNESTPELNKLRINQYQDQVKLFDDQISEKQQQYDLSDDEEERKALKRELMDLERQRFQAQLGIIDAKLASITMYRTDMQDRLSTLDTDYVVDQADSKVVNDANDPKMRALKEEMLKKQVAEYDKQIADQEALLPGASDEETKQINRELADLKKTRAQALISTQDMRLSSIGLYRDDMNTDLDEMSVEYLKKKVDTGITDESNPILKNFRVGQYNDQVAMFSEEIAKLQTKLPDAQSDEEAKSIQQEIRDLQKQQYQAQLGILDEIKTTGGTFNLPDGVKAMSYYEYMTRNNTQSAYTVQQGDTNVQISLPNVTDGTSADKLKQIGKSIGQGINEGRKLRPQMLQNPYGYRTPV